MKTLQKLARGRLLISWEGVEQDGNGYSAVLSCLKSLEGLLKVLEYMYSNTPCRLTELDQPNRGFLNRLSICDKLPWVETPDTFVSGPTKPHLGTVKGSGEETNEWHRFKHLFS